MLNFLRDAAPQTAEDFITYQQRLDRGKFTMQIELNKLKRSFRDKIQDVMMWINNERLDYMVTECQKEYLYLKFLGHVYIELNSVCQDCDEIFDPILV